MVLPSSWNIREPIQLAQNLQDLVVSLRSASGEWRSFGTKIEALNNNLQSLQSQLHVAFPTQQTEVRSLQRTLEQCQVTTNNCAKFHAQHRSEIGQATRWAYRKETATRLGKDVDNRNSELQSILRTLRQRRRDPQEQGTVITSPSSMERTSSSTQTDMPHGRTPAEFLNVNWDRPFVVSRSKTHEFASAVEDPPSPEVARGPQSDASSITSSKYSSTFSPSTAQTTPDTRRHSSLQIGRPSPDLTMDNLSGVQISYYRDTARVSFPVSKIEFVKDSRGQVEWIICSTNDELNVKLYQHTSPSKRFIPHSEHPVAYGSENIRRVKFLQPHLLRSQKLSESPEHKTSMKPLGTPKTVSSFGSGLSKSTASSAPSAKVGSFTKEAETQEYDFEREADYSMFQERIVGMRLLVNAPVTQINCRRRGHSKSLRECGEQYIRLWAHQNRQTIMYYADEIDQYREFNVEYFQPDNHNHSSRDLKLNVRLPGAQSTSRPKGAGLFKSKPTTEGKGDGREAQTTPSHGDDKIPEELAQLESLTITFSDASGKTIFLEKAKFNGIS